MGQPAIILMLPVFSYPLAYFNCDCGKVPSCGLGVEKNMQASRWTLQPGDDLGDTFWWQTFELLHEADQGAAQHVADDLKEVAALGAEQDC